LDCSLAYGDQRLQVALPAGTRIVAGLAESMGGGTGGVEPVPDEAAAVSEALANPLGVPRIGESLRPDSRVLIAFDDPTVVSYGPFRRLAIEAVLEEIACAGVPESNVTLLCANALHRRWTHEELASVLGDELVRRSGERLLCHDAEDADGLVYLGQTAAGYDVEVNRLVADCDLTVYVNAQAHLGFSGGWKSVCVGLSTWRTIRWTHTPHGTSMSLRDNRMHAVFDEMGAHLESTLGKRVFKIETVMAGLTRAARVWAGGVSETRAAALEFLLPRYPARRSVAEPADVIIYGVPNWSPYATMARMNPILTLISTGLGYLGGYIEALGKPGCSVIIGTPCPEQWDLEHHLPYPEVWARVLPETRDPYEITERYMDKFATNDFYIESYRFGYCYHPVHAVLATHPLKRLRHAGRVFVAGPDDPAVPRHVGFIPAKSVEDAVREAERIHGRDCSMTCVT
jgi:hypothetical protein